MAEEPNKHREVSVSEFFEKNKHLLGFDSPREAVVMTVKEGVDNSLDACEEAGILPDIRVRLTKESDIMVVSIMDNGPGISSENITGVFCKLLFGSKFDSWTASRGAQGLGISAAGMYGYLTTRLPMTVFSKQKGKEGIGIRFHIDTKTNAAKIIEKLKCEDKLFPEGHGTFVSIPMDGAYQKGRASVDAYIEATAFSNPHANIYFVNTKKEIIKIDRVIDTVPPKPKRMKPYPTGIVYGTFVEILSKNKNESLRKVLTSEFSNINMAVINFLLDGNQKVASLKVSEILENDLIVKKIFFNMSLLCAGRLTHHTAESVARKVLKAKNALKEFVAANYEGIPIEKAQVVLGEYANMQASSLKPDMIKKLHSALTKKFFSIDPPRMDALVPIGLESLKKRLLQRGAGSVIVNNIEGLVVKGNPMMIEIGIGFEGNLKKDTSSDIMRFANRVPLLFSPKSCAITETITSIDWSSCGVSHKAGETPSGAMIFVVHISSTWIPFTNQAKEAILHEAEIVKALKKGLMECRKGIEMYLNEKNKDKERALKLKALKAYAAELEVSLKHVVGDSANGLADILMALCEKEK